MNKKIAAAKFWQIRILLGIIPVLVLAACNSSNSSSGGSSPSPAASPYSPPASPAMPALPGAPVPPPAISPIPANLGASTLKQSEPPLNSPAARAGEQQDANTEEYNRIYDNPFERVSITPLSTFSIDVDTASYTNVRRFIKEGKLPPKDAVRIEELINYFTYDYPQPTGDRPFSITTEISEAPWNSQHRLVKIGLQGKRIATENLPPSNLVFLLDVSGSMNEPNKLPLLKQSLRLLANQLTEKALVSIVVYAGAAGVVLPPTNGKQKDKILDAIEQLEAGGSTAGGEGIKLAYELASRTFISSGNNRVILATDGDFNVGVSSDAELVRLIEKYRDRNIFLTVLGFGTGNLKDAKMEQIANKGNGNYAYIDSLLEAKKVLVKEMGANLLTIAKDVKLQVEFNPTQVQGYRLIGYENRQLAAADFNNDKKDAGELGAGHSVTALYEIIPVGVESDVKLPDVGELKYQKQQVDPAAYKNDELMLVKLRYKVPDRTTSQLIQGTVAGKGVKIENASDNMKFAAAVAEYGMLLRDSEYKGEASFEQVLQLANQSNKVDLDGYRAEFISLVENSKKLARKR
ncbi:MAG: VWA domain-containing protein [Oscillatoriaceae cyanobacterium Prado104]|nr:VWA domain-containing protein [Oscillatoriaceae cyanobacterium Prado104]